MASNTFEFKKEPTAPASVAVVRAVANIKKQTHEELQPLNDVIDPDALDTIIAGTTANTQVTFEYEGYSVVVQSDKVVVDTHNDR